MNPNQPRGGGLKPQPEVPEGDIAIMRELATTMLDCARRCEGRLGLDLAAWSVKIRLRANDLDQAAPAGHVAGRLDQAPQPSTR